MKPQITISVSMAMAGAYGASCPPSITAQVPGPYHRSETMLALHKRLLSCPDARSLDLRVALEGCSAWPDRWNFPFRLAGGERYPALTSLTLDGYRFDHSDWEDAQQEKYGGILDWINFHGAEKYVRLWIDTPVDRRQLRNLELWLEAMDWSALESLELRDGVEGYFADLAPPRLMGLKHLAVKEGWKQNKSIIPRLLTSLPDSVHLQSLTWIDSQEYAGLPEVLERHCDSLKRIQLYSSMPSSVNTLSKELLDVFAERCQGLEQVSVALDRNGSWPWEHLATLSRIPGLVSTDIWFELSSDCMSGTTQWEPPPCDKGNLYREPRLNAFHAKEMFNFVQEQRKKETLVPLRTMIFYEGEKVKFECNFMENGTPKGPDDELCVGVGVTG
ncbi:hypothetical protein DL768_009515 [Monosporascus sp. mg162]|nr:hypothetical protein DL768_009515 [Monosporascus sp. mg162]